MKRIYRSVFVFLILLFAVFLLCSCNEKEKKNTIKKMEIDYDSAAIVGTSLKNFSALFDEQKTAGDPKNNVILFPSTSVALYDVDNDKDIDDIDKNHEYEVTVDMGCNCYVDSIYAFYYNEGYSLKVELGTPFNYEKKVETVSERSTWKSISVEYESRFLNFRFINGKAPDEILIYGYEKEEKNTEPVEVVRKAKPFSYFLGINGNRGDYSSQLACGNYFRDYINWGAFYLNDVYPKPATMFTGLNNNYELTYKTMIKNGLSPVPCLMFNPNEVIVKDSSKDEPSSYVKYGEMLYQIAFRFGSNPNLVADDALLLSGRKKASQDIIKWIELGNEPNGEGNDGMTPYQLAALTSCGYDGHNGTVTAPDGSGVGVKNADPNMNVAMAGLAGIGTDYIKAMAHWMTYNRTDGSLAMDAFNVHTYCRKELSYNGYNCSIGVCPEVGEITKDLEKLVAFRDANFPNTEIWVTEFGWDTNQSYETENSAHAYGEYTGRQVQAMWLVRAYFMFAKAGVDRCAMYMCKDCGAEESTVGKYGTSGVVTSDGKEKKDSFYYISTLKIRMADMYFSEVISSGNDNVWIYKFTDGNGKDCYALWCPTMDGTKVNNFKFDLKNYKTVNQITFENLNTEGVQSAVTVQNGTASLNISECPILLICE